jgi:RNA polymerase sigma factor (sigma-70 family)
MTTPTINPHLGQTDDEIIAGYHSWLFKTASGMTSNSSDVEDLVQEGRVAMWLALDSYDPAKGSLPSWLTRKAKFRMIEVVTDGPLTGQPSRRHGRNPATEMKRATLSLDLPRGDSGVNLADLVSRDVGDLEAAELAYHQDEIASAIEALPDAQRKYVIARFYEAMTGSEMREAGLFSYDPSALWTSQKNGARMKLAEKLRHLEDMV